MSDLDEIIREFLIESHENLDRLDRDFVELEKNPGDLQLLSSIFRTIHTLKGTCGFFSFHRLQAVSHAGESLLGLLRDGVLPLRTEISSTLLRMIDVIRHLLLQIEQFGKEQPGDDSELLQELNRLQNFTEECSDTPINLEHSSFTPIVGQKSESDSKLENGSKDGGSRSTADQTVRIDVALLDRLVNLVGELVLSRNQILQLSNSSEDSQLQKTTQRLNTITAELQENVMKTRMQPINTIWRRYPRMVRDTAMQCGKLIQFEMIGGETELDRSLIEMIRDPLIHILRNAIDHGIERPEIRRQAGKPPEGQIQILAYHEGGQVIIEFRDDGSGIDPNRVLKKALEKNLIQADQVEHLTENSIIQFIFLPGFSTADQVTTISGRGVGMDVVKTNIEKIGGSLDLQSNLGEGTTIKLKIPLTLAIVPALIVSCADHRFAIPQISLVELVRLSSTIIQQQIDYVHDAPILRLRGTMLPLIQLSDQLGLCAPKSLLEAEELNIVVLEADGHPFGLIVDRIHDTEEIVVKPLSKHLKHIPQFAGATIMGDGRVALIIDVIGLAQTSSIFEPTSYRRLFQTQSEVPSEQELTSWMMMQIGRRRIAIPLHEISRLEEIQASSIEYANGQEVVQYRQQLLPLVRLATLLHESVETQPLYQKLKVVVYVYQGHKIGLIVDHILDVVEAADLHFIQREHDVIVASVVLNQRVTDLLNLPQLLQPYLSAIGYGTTA